MQSNVVNSRGPARKFELSKGYTIIKNSRVRGKSSRIEGLELKKFELTKFDCMYNTNTVII